MRTNIEFELEAGSGQTWEGYIPPQTADTPSLYVQKHTLLSILAELWYQGRIKAHGVDALFEDTVIWINSEGSAHVLGPQPDRSYLVPPEIPWVVSAEEKT